MYRLPILGGILVSAVALGGLAAEPAWGENLTEALAQAYQNNPTLLARRARLRATDEQVPQALSGWRPTVSLSGDAGLSHVESNQATVRTQNREPRSASLSVSQPLFSGFRTVAATSAAKNSVQAERARLMATEQSVLLDVATAYVNVVRDQAVVELNRNNEQVLTRQLEATRDRFEVGEITRTDVHQAEARLARAKADRIQAEGNLEASRAAYENVVGTKPGTLERPAPIDGLPGDLSSAVKAAVSGNPNVVATFYDEQGALDSVRQVRGELLPSLSLDGSASRAYDASSDTSRSDNYVAKLSLNVPLYQAGAVYSRLRQARQTAAETRQSGHQARRDATEAATRAWEALQTAKAQTQSFNAQIEAAKIALDGVQREATVGSRTVLDVLDAEQELLDAQVSLVRSQRDETVAQFELRSAIGLLTAQHMNLPVDLYDFDAHYQEVRDKWFGGTSSGDSSQFNAKPDN
ncbi:MAG: TolC family outer membrane protein [Hyphomicrobiales bacterium]|nr:TolC family outer membrane protein [Hyphomicrobiales bacterium]MCP5374422.1 TolC family outer membrane protein [Hyphomicrobiales bacterium]